MEHKRNLNMNFLLTLIVFVFTAQSSYADVDQAKKLSLSFLTGFHVSATNNDVTTDEAQSGFELGPMLYFNLNEKVTVRTSFTYKKQEIQVGNNYDFVLISDDYTRIKFGQLLLSAGVQYNFTRKISIFGDLNYSFNSFGKSCTEAGSNFFNFDCADALADLKDNFLFFKSGVSMRFIKWLRIEPYLNISLNDAGKVHLKESVHVGANLVLSL